MEISGVSIALIETSIETFARSFPPSLSLPNSRYRSNAFNLDPFLLSFLRLHQSLIPTSFPPPSQVPPNLTFDDSESSQLLSFFNLGLTPCASYRLPSPVVTFHTFPSFAPTHLDQRCLRKLNSRRPPTCKSQLSLPTAVNLSNK